MRSSGGGGQILISVSQRPSRTISYSIEFCAFSAHAIVAQDYVSVAFSSA